jgi:hypothetical protein
VNQQLAGSICLVKCKSVLIQPVQLQVENSFCLVLRAFDEFFHLFINNFERSDLRNWGIQPLSNLFKGQTQASKLKCLNGLLATPNLFRGSLLLQKFPLYALT